MNNDSWLIFTVSNLTTENTNSLCTSSSDKLQLVKVLQKSHMRFIKLNSSADEPLIYFRSFNILKFSNWKFLIHNWRLHQLVHCSSLSHSCPSPLIDSRVKTIKKAFNPFTFKSGGWLESSGKWTLLWVSKEVPAPGRCQIVKVKTKSGERLSAWKC